MDDTETTARAEREREREVGEAALEVLVNQFQNPYDFIRELVQNSLDSGTPEVDVWTTFHDTGEGRGVAEIHVDDYGTGMDEHLIDARLTRLFSSSKEDDRTNIGKFGIGFVSVFAISPEGVLVRTARAGERWEVFFEADRSFIKTRVEDPFEGTQITVFKAMHESDYKGAVDAVAGTLKFWCKHAEKQIHFEDRTRRSRTARRGPGRLRERRLRPGRILINETMRVHAYLPIRVEVGETEMVLGFHDVPFYGFYNKGLTLTETRSLEGMGRWGAFFQNVSFKVKSPLLEHTLTRDTIRKDAGFHKVMGMLAEAARTDLVGRLMEEIEELAGRETLEGEELDAYLKALGWLFRLPRELDPTFRLKERLADTRDNVARTMLGRSEKEPEQKSLDAEDRKLFRRCNDRAYCMSELRGCMKKSDGHLMFYPTENERTRRLMDKDRYVFLAPIDGHTQRFFFDHVTGEPTKQEDMPRVGRMGEDFWLVDRLKRRELSDDQRKFIVELEERLGEIGFPLRDLVPAHFHGIGPYDNVLSGVIGKKNMVMERTMVPPGPDAEPVDIAVNLDCETARRLVEHHGSHPELTMLLAAKRVVLENVDSEPMVRELVVSLVGGRS